MNLLHMKYAVEIAEAKSINRASETLFVGQLRLGGAVRTRCRQNVPEHFQLHGDAPFLSLL